MYSGVTSEEALADEHSPEAIAALLVGLPKWATRANRGTRDGDPDAYDKLCGIVAKVTLGEYTASDVRTWLEHSVLVSGRLPGIGKETLTNLLYVRKVPNMYLRERLIERLAEGSENMVGVAAGAYAHLQDSTWADGFAPKNIRAQLGMIAIGNAEKQLSCAFLITYERAVALAKTIGMTPKEAGV